MLNARIDACAQAGVSVGMQQYLQGREVGLQSYCRVDLAAQRGLGGESYDGVCPPAVDPEFRRRFSIGRAVFLARLEVADVRRSREINEKTAREDPSEEARRRARTRLIELDYELRRALDVQYDAERRLQALGQGG